MSASSCADVVSPQLASAAGEGPRGHGQADRSRSVGIVGIAAGLMAIGAVMAFSAGASIDRPLTASAFWTLPAARQVVFLAGGLVAMLIMTHVPYRIWSAWGGRLALGLLLAALVALLLVFVPGVGVEVNNARRWVRVGPADYDLRFQPSELLKAAMPIFLADWMARRAGVRAFWRGFVPVVAAIGIGVVGVGLEDFGTAVLLAAVAGMMLLMGGAKWRHILLLVLPGLLAFGYLLVSRPHRLDRLLTFVDIWRDPEGKGYQAVQSLCTIASGGWWGRGLGCGVVKGYLPEARNDFIFAVICEELGMVGAVAVIGLLIALIWQGRGVIHRCIDPMGRLLAFGILATLGLQATMNLAVVTVSVPTKGISLPLVSAGGSGAVLLGGLVGMLANIARGNRLARGCEGIPEP